MGIWNWCHGRGTVLSDFGHVFARGVAYFHRFRGQTLDQSGVASSCGFDPCSRLRAIAIAKEEEKFAIIVDVFGGRRRNED